jgi:hypothetical protein
MTKWHDGIILLMPKAQACDRKWASKSHFHLPIHPEIHPMDTSSLDIADEDLQSDPDAIFDVKIVRY